MRAIYSPFILILSAFLTGLAQHPLQLGWLVWFTLIPLIFVFNRITIFRHFIMAGLIWGCAYHLTVIFWLAGNIGTTPLTGFISMLSAVLFLALNIIAVSFIMYFLKNKFPKKWFWYFPVVWVSMEYIRSMGTLGFPWVSLANTQLDFLTLAQNVEITGIYGISFWIVLINVLMFNWLVRPFRENFLWILFFFMFPWITGWFLIPELQNDNEFLEVAVIQPNIHLYQKWKPGATKENITTLLDISNPALKQNVDLIIWPESSISTYLLQENDSYLKWIQRELKDTKLIAGIPYFSGVEPERKYYNSVALIQADSISNVYHKMKLVPMAEYIPFSNIFPSLKKLNLGQANFTHGEEHKIMNVNNFKCAAMICFESTFPSISRQFINDGAEVLIYVINDGWYEHPPEPQQHAKQAIYRAIENRRPVIRCTNTGISMVVDAGGNISHQIPLNEKGMIQARIQTHDYATFYTRYGDIFSKLNVLLCISFIIAGIFRWEVREK